jgi:hypothetical protein
MRGPEGVGLAGVDVEALGRVLEDTEWLRRIADAGAARG